MGFIGYTYNHFVGGNFRRVPRSALRLRPVAYRYKTAGDWVFALAYSLRFYPKGLEQEDFISGLQAGSRDSEWVQSFSFDVSLPSFTGP